jgi:hypothetical protein
VPVPAAPVMLTIATAMLVVKIPVLEGSAAMVSAVAVVVAVASAV